MLTCSKMNGNGNDFLVIDNMDLAMDGESLSKFAVSACRRRVSLGADGVLVAEPSSKAAFKMRLFNCDGSEGEMCGNGARCMARYAFEKGIAVSCDMVFETLGGDVHAVVCGNSVYIDMSPVSTAEVVLNAKASVGGLDFVYSFLTVGVPHVVIFEENRSRSTEEYTALGRAVRNMTNLFPHGANVNFAVKNGGNSLDVITYERGVEDLTLSCGTGSTACAVAAFLLGETGSCVEVENPGGINRVSLELSSGTILPRLEGRALMIADISLFPDAFL